jgi:hypothetical protein
MAYLNNKTDMLCITYEYIVYPHVNSLDFIHLVYVVLTIRGGHRDRDRSDRMVVGFSSLKFQIMTPLMSRCPGHNII